MTEGKRFIDKLKQGTGSLSDEEFAMIKLFVEKGDRDAAHVTVAPVDTAQYRSPARLLPKYRPMYVSVWKRTKRVWWNRSETSSNHYRPVRVFKHPESRITQARAQDEPPPPAACPRA